MAPGKPTVVVEVDVTNQPRSGTSTWTDITAYVWSPVTINRGRRDRLTEQLTPATCSFDLNDNDKRFTPSYSGGPYGSNFGRGTPVRVTVTTPDASVTSRRFLGYIDAIDGPRWPGGNSEKCVVTVSCVDDLAHWHRGRTMESFISETILADNPQAYYPLCLQGRRTGGGLRHHRQRHHKHDKTSHDNKETQNWQELQAILPQNIQFYDVHRGDHTDRDNDHLEIQRANGGGAFFWNHQGRHWQGGSAYFSKVYGGATGATWLSQTITTDGASAKWALECWVRSGQITGRDVTPATGGGGGTASDKDVAPPQVGFFCTLQNGNRWMGIGTNTDGVLRVLQTDGTSTSNLWGHRLDDAGWKHVLVYYNRNSTSQLYVNGGQRDSMSSLNWDASTTTPKLIVGMATENNDSSYAPQGAFVSHVAFYTGADADSAVANVKDHFNAGWDGYSGFSTSAMMTRLARWSGWPGSTNIQAGLGTCEGSGLSGVTALDYAQTLVNSEQGNLFVKPNGTLTFHNRSFRYNNASTLTVTMPPQDLALSTDESFLANKVVVARANGKPGKAHDRTSIQTYGPHTLHLETVLKSQAEARGVARYVLARRKTSTPRLWQVPLDLLTEPNQSIVNAAMNVEMDDRVVVQGLPSQAHSSSMTGYVEGWTETIGRPVDAVWSIVFNTSPAWTRTGDLVLGSGVLGTNTLSY